MSVIAVTCDVLLALSRTRENSPIPKAGAFTTETVGSVIGLFAGDGSVVSNLIIDLVDIVNPLEVLTIMFLDTST